MSWRAPETAGEKLRATLLQPLSVLYFAGVCLRLTAYRTGLCKQIRLPVPVISVGNLTVGGTGKTPVVIDLAKRLAAAGHKVGILSRGYKRKSNKPIVVVSDGKTLLCSPEDAGDEPYLIAQSVPEAVVIVGSRRAKSGLTAIKDFNCNVLILDDGFQHISLVRDCDIVLIDYQDDLNNKHLLPAGDLREPLTALASANWVVISKVPKDPDLERLDTMRQQINKLAPQAQVTFVSFPCLQAKRLYTNKNVDVNLPLAGTKVFAFSAIARPESFHETLTDLGAIITGSKSFPDHHWLDDKDLQSLKIDFAQSEAEIIVTTQKDRVRLPAELFSELPMAELILECSWLGPVPALTGGSYEQSLQAAT